MNWKQIYTASTPREREQVVQSVLECIEATSNQILRARIESLQQSKGKALHERRQLLHWAHFIGMRPTTSKATRTLCRGLFFFILGTLSLAIAIIAITIHPTIGAPLIFGYSIILLMILLIKPYALRGGVRISRAARQQARNY